MGDRTPVDVKNLDSTGNEPLPWSRALDDMAAKPFLGTTFLSTARPDGRPHAAGIGAVTLDGDIYFTSGPGTRKSRNLALNPACAISTRLATIDLVFEGEAVRVTDGPTLERAAARLREGGWPAQVEGDAITAPYAAPSPGSPPWNLYRFTFHTVIGNATAKPDGATRWHFGV